MRKRFLILFFLSLSTMITAQEEMAFFDHLVQNQYDKASSYFNKDLNLCILDFENMVNSNEARERVGKFFNTHPPVSYSVSHNGNSKGGQSSYYVLRMKTSRGTFRMFAYFDKIGTQFKISELRIEP